jgi:hypothetical protein
MNVTGNVAGALFGATKTQASEILGVPVTKVGPSIGGRAPDPVYHWDGESWGHQGKNTFCTGRCAEEFGYAVAKVTTYICYDEGDA